MMLNKFHKQQNQKGFTLIELLIVVAIIGILAAIAIPQFAAYRERAYNSAANSDLRNIKIGFEAFMADFQQYPTATTTTSQVVAVSGTGATGLGTVIGRLSTNVNLVYIPDVTTAAGVATTFATTTVNTNGTFFFGTASDSTAMFRAPRVVGTTATAAITAANATAFISAATPPVLATNWTQL